MYHDIICAQVFLFSVFSVWVLCSIFVFKEWVNGIIRTNLCMDPINGLGKTQEETHVTQVKDANPGILDTILILDTIQIIANVLGIRRHQVTVLDIAIGKLTTMGVE